MTFPVKSPQRNRQRQKKLEREGRRHGLEVSKEGWGDEFSAGATHLGSQEPTERHLGSL